MRPVLAARRTRLPGPRPGRRARRAARADRRARRRRGRGRRRSRDADFADQSLVFRVAAAAARLGVPFSRRALRTLSANVPGRSASSGPSAPGGRSSACSAAVTRWCHGRGARARTTCSAGSCRSGVTCAASRSATRSTYTVDRHLLPPSPTPPSSSATVSRPDLLLVGALLHDIGKGYPGDHTEVGMELSPRSCRGWASRPRTSPSISRWSSTTCCSPRRPPAATCATRARPPTWPRRRRPARAWSCCARSPRPTASRPARRRGRRGSESLIDELTGRSRPSFARPARPRGTTSTSSTVRPHARPVRLGGGVCAEHEQLGEFDRFSVATHRPPGLFAQVAGTLALHRVDVVGAEAWTSADGIAVEQFDIVRAPGPSRRRSNASSRISST